MAGAWFARRPRRRARASTDRLLPAVDAIMAVPNYGATTAKAALQLLGVIDNRAVRSPCVPLTTTRSPRCAPASRRPA